jgi:hypothetical protein
MVIDKCVGKVSRETLTRSISILKEAVGIGQCTTQALSEVQALACFAPLRELFVSREGAKPAKWTLGRDDLHDGEYCFCFGRNERIMGGFETIIGLRGGIIVFVLCLRAHHGGFWNNNRAVDGGWKPPQGLRGDSSAVS